MTIKRRSFRIINTLDGDFGNRGQDILKRIYTDEEHKYKCEIKVNDNDNDINVFIEDGSLLRYIGNVSHKKIVDFIQAVSNDTCRMHIELKKKKRNCITLEGEDIFIESRIILVWNE